MRYAMMIATVFAGLLSVAAPASAETLEEVEKKIAELTAKHKSAEARMKTKTDLSNEQMSEKSESDSTVIYLKKGEKWLMRNDTKSKGVRKIADGPEEKVESRILNVYDGEYSYTLIESPEFKQATKQKMVQSQSPFGKEVWEEMRKHFESKLLPDETIDGKSVWVIESRVKPEADATPEQKAVYKNMRTVTHYRKSDGAVVKTVTYEKDKPTVTMTLQDIKYDIEPKPDTFKFVAPEGVTVMDMDQLAAGQGAPAAGGEPTAGGTDTSKASAEDKPKEEPKAQQQPKEEEKPKEEPKKERGVKGLLKKLR